MKPILLFACRHDVLEDNLKVIGLPRMLATDAIAYGWRQEALAKNAQEVADLGRQLYERIAVLAGHWGNVRKRLDQAVGAYNSSVATLESRVLVSARRLRDLKAAPEETEIEAIEPGERATRALPATPAIAGSPDKRRGRVNTFAHAECCAIA